MPLITIGYESRAHSITLGCMIIRIDDWFISFAMIPLFK